MVDHNPSILIVDDDPGIRTTYRMILGKSYNYFYAETKKEAEVEIGQHSYSLILLDLELPDGSGLSLLPLIKEQNPDASVIIVTGMGSYEASLEAIRYQVAGFIEKDFSAFSFQELITNTLSERQKRLLLRSVEKDLVRSVNSSSETSSYEF